jgi:hypothetical protein
MKPMKITFIIWTGLMMLGWLFSCYFAGAQPDPGMNGDSTLVGGGPISGGVPLGSGALFFLLFGIGYGIRKWIGEKRKSK